MYLRITHQTGSTAGTDFGGHKVRRNMATHVKNTMRASVGLLLAMALPVSAQAEQKLLEVNTAPLGKNRHSIELKLDGLAPQPSVFALETPPRISIDLPDTKLALEQRRIPLNVGPVQTLTAVEASGRSRIVLSLSELTPYTVRADGNSVVVELDGPSRASSAIKRPVSAGVVKTTAPASSANASGRFSSIDFRRTETGSGRLMVELGVDAAEVDVRSEGGKIVAVFRGIAPTDDMLSRMDVLDFATPFKFIDVSRDGSDGRIAITPVSGAQFDQVAYQLGGSFTLELQPLSKQEQEQRAREEPQYQGERLNVNFQNIEVRALLQIIADVAGKNLVTSDSVSGSITLRLENVPWDQALDIILRTKGLSKSEAGNVIWVAPTAEVAAQQKQELEAMKQAEELAPLVGEIIQVNYAKAIDLASLLADEDSSFVSERGTITVDQRTNVLIVNDTREKLAGIQSLVRRLDVPVRQVLIESRVVVANDDFSRSIGTSFGVSFANIGSDVTIAGSGNIGAATELQNLTSGTAFDVVDSNRLSTTFPAASDGVKAPSYGVSILGSDFLVDLELSALQAEGKGEVVSTPRVITANGKEALIEQGEEIPYINTVTAGGGAAQQTQFKKAVLSLRVTPQITPDDRVIMDLEVSKDTRGALAAQGQPAIDTSSVNTQVLVNNGETVVLGGIFEQATEEGVNKVPLLGDIPILGFLFRNTIRRNDKRELLIFVTPKILSDGIKTN